MKSTCKILLIIVFFTLLHGRVQAQQFLYKAGFLGFFDNREYFNDYVNDQTIFGTRISGELGYSFNSHTRFMTGADYLYEFGTNEWNAPAFTAYFNTNYRKTQLYLGAFPRFDKINMPLALMNDTFIYYRPNMEGILLEYTNTHFRHNIWIDWTGRQSAERQEKFLLGFSGSYNKGIFLYRHHFVMTHLAHTLSTNVEEHIRDNGAFCAMPGLNFSGITGLDSLSFSAGVLLSYDRVRGIYGFRFPVGFMAELSAIYKGFGLESTLYAGDHQTITSGDGFYKSSFYSRTDVFYQVSAKGIDGKVQVSGHIVPGVFDLSMSLVIRASIDGAFKHHQSN